MTTRRQFLKQLSTTAGVGVAASLGLSFATPRLHAAPATDGWHMPDEHLPQERVFLAYAASSAIWKDWASEVNSTVAMLARTIARYQPVTILCREQQEDDARDECGTDNVDYLPLPLNDIWVRDYGGCFVLDRGGRLGLVDFNFNGWGKKQASSNDTRVAKALGTELEATYIRSRLTGEGGGIEVNGHGTAILTESCWINDNRNPGLSKAQIDAELKSLLGLRKIIWLPGIKSQDITDAHIDFYARFAKPGVVIANLDNDPDSHDYPVTRRHLDILKSATDAEGRKLQVHTLPPPTDPRRNVYTENNPSFAAGYINFLSINGALIAPQFGDAAADGYCRELLQQLYPGREVVQVNIDPIAAGGGGIHCVTKQLPRVAGTKESAGAD
ncbi:agmatine deiminase family protein [Dyella tabacisoli]|uniref:Agmatine deiminase family protein n=1 Tax=Dyella tabacisoli TaxID=2282381 RepID=A0A369UMA3_9GAMM|nr:agmatine deiminase family protein [Dyella tabacisoli]RDD81215.1 agmatine deiminase family protein [Dyella tabacisoli]